MKSINCFDLGKTVRVVKVNGNETFQEIVMINPCLGEELCVPRTPLLVAKDVASPSDALEQREDLGNAGSRCTHPHLNKGVLLEEHRQCVEDSALDLVCQGSDQTLCHPRADSTELQTPQKPRQGGKSDQMLGCVCSVALLVRFFGVVAGGSEQRGPSSFPWEVRNAHGRVAPRVVLQVGSLLPVGPFLSARFPSWKSLAAGTIMSPFQYK